MDAAAVQGNVLVPFKKPYAEFVLLRLPQRAATARAWLGETAERLVTTADLLERNRRGEQTWHALGLTRSGLEALGLTGLDRELAEHYAFLAGPEARARDLGDVGDSAPAGWRFGTARNPVDAVVTVAADEKAALDAAVAELRDVAADHYADVAGSLHGHWYDGRREHFGFADGGGQPRVSGVDEDGDVELGEFIVDGDGPEWLQGAAFQVLRQLEQDVRGWRAAAQRPEERIRAHIHKTRPGRAHDPQQRHRIIRRGIPYGPPFDEAPEAERGMLFNAFVGSIGRQYEFVQRLWANQVDFPAAGAGWDPVIGGPDPQEAGYRAAAPARYVHTRGAVYAVALTPSAARRVASGAWASAPA